MIAIDRGRWDSIHESFRKVHIVLHEYLGIMRIEDSQYQVSGQLDRANACKTNEFVRVSLETALGKSCWRMIKDDLRYVEELELEGYSFINSDVYAKDFKNIRVKEIDFHEANFIEGEALEFGFINPNGRNRIYIDQPMGLLNANTIAGIKDLSIIEIQFRDNEEAASVLSSDIFTNHETLETVIFGSYYTSHGYNGQLKKLSKVLRTLNKLSSSVKKVYVGVMLKCDSKSGRLVHDSTYGETLNSESLDTISELNKTMIGQGFRCHSEAFNSGLFVKN